MDIIKSMDSTYTVSLVFTPLSERNLWYNKPSSLRGSAPAIWNTAGGRPANDSASIGETSGVSGGGGLNNSVMS